MKLWIDVEDLFAYAGHVARPSGIQRVGFELQQALRTLLPGDVAFLRHRPDRLGFEPVPFETIAALFGGLSGTDIVAPPLPPPPPPRPPFWPRLLWRALGLLPPGLRAGLRRLLRRPRPTVPATAPAAAPPPGPGADANAPWRIPIAPGQANWLLSLGSPWPRADYTAFIAAQRQASPGLRFGVLIYDIIPIRCPEWADDDVFETFSHWLDGILPMADAVFAISRFTAADVTAYARGRNLALARPVAATPLGHGFSHGAASAGAPRPLPPPRSYVLLAGTIEARKNHRLAFDAWAALARTMPPGALPTLVFAGRVGWLVDALMHDLAETNWLGGLILHIDAPTDAELSILYRDCLFTLFPSLYEGWGLPVTESLAHGAPCLASNRTSIPEAGGKLARYFDPGDLAAATAAIRAVLENRRGLEAWQRRIARRYRPRPWSATAMALVDGLKDKKPLFFKKTRRKKLLN